MCSFDGRRRSFLFFLMRSLNPDFKNIITAPSRPGKEPTSRGGLSMLLCWGGCVLFQGPELVGCVSGVREIVAEVEGGLLRPVVSCAVS